MNFDIRRYNFERLFSPGIINITKPGLILQNNPGVFSNKKFISRSIYVFEENFIDLYLDTLSEIGLESCNDLWYEIGKDISYRFFLNYQSMKINKFNIEKILRFFCNHFCAVGMSCCEHVDFDFKKEKFVFTGDNSVICRRFNNGSYNAGVLSGLMSFLLKKNIEADFFCEDCPNGCAIIVDKEFPYRYVPSYYTRKEISDHKPDLKEKKALNSGLSSFSDFLKFKIIQVDKERKFDIYGKTLIPVEVGFPGVVARAYFRWGLLNLYKKSFKNSIDKMIHIFVKKSSSLEENITRIRNIFSALGWGESYFTIEKNKISVRFLSPIFICGDVFIVDLIIESLLNYLFEEEFKLFHKDNSLLVYFK